MQRDSGHPDGLRVPCAAPWKGGGYVQRPACLSRGGCWEWEGLPTTASGAEGKLGGPPGVTQASLLPALTGNKGAVGVSFMFNGTSFGFVNCHLTSGNEKTAR